MPMLAFFPWIKLREAVRAGLLQAFTHVIGQPLPPDVPTTLLPETLEKLFAQYGLAPHLPLRALTSLRHDDHALGDDLKLPVRTSQLGGGGFHSYQIGGYPCMV